MISSLSTNSLIILLLLSISVRAQEPEPKGELRIYHRGTQIGTAAAREFKDDKGRLIKAIYYTYTGESDSGGNFREELLREQSTSTFEYDESGCPSKSKNYDRGFKLLHTYEVTCFEGTATPKLTIIRNSHGVKTAEKRHTATGAGRAMLYFDSDGDKVVGISGELPADADLVHGWGDPLRGFALGIAGNREKGQQEELRVHVTIKNVSHDAEPLVMISPIQIELKDASGRLVEPKTAYRPNLAQIQSDECPSYMKEGAPGTGRSQFKASYALGEQFNRLAPGNYSITVAYCVSGVSGRLVSNTIVLEVEGK